MKRPPTIVRQVTGIATLATAAALVLAAVGTSTLHAWQEEQAAEHPSEQIAVPGTPPEPGIRKGPPMRQLVPWLLVYVVVWAGVLAVHALVVRKLLRSALAPLGDAADAAARVTGLGRGARLDESGPVEVRTLLASINALLARLETAFATQTRFTAEAAHELRTPLTSIRGEIELALRRERSDEEYRAALRGALVGVERLGDVVEGLLALAQVDAGRADLGREPEHARALALSAVAREVSTLEGAGCVVRVDVRDDPEVQVHSALVELALANLLRNAARYAAGGTVLLTVSRDGADLAFVVDDRGPGVPAEDREEVFHRFARGAEARRAHPDGLGLGLPFAREVARRHGGDCVIADNPDGGCRARLTIRVPLGA